MELAKTNRRAKAPYSDRTACIEVNKAGTLNVSKKICAAVSLFVRGFKGASVNNTGCYSSPIPISKLAPPHPIPQPYILPKLTSSDKVFNSSL